MEGITFLTDPIFSERCSFWQQAGTKRYRKPACTVADLPHVDAVVISHNHYDHLDLNSVKELNQKFGEKIHWFVPAGLEQWMRNQDCERVTGMCFKGQVQRQKKG